jgi:hypothetical protein
VKTLRLLLFCALAIPASLSAAGHDVSAIGLTTLPCCNPVYTPDVATAWDGTRFLTIASVVNESTDASGLYGWFSDADPALPVTSPFIPQPQLFPFSGQVGQYWGLLTQSGARQLVHLDSGGRLLSSVQLNDGENTSLLAASYNGKQVLMVTIINNGGAESGKLTVYDVKGQLLSSTM